MALVIPEDYAHVVHSMTFSGDPEPYACTYGVKVDTATYTDATALSNQLDDAWGDALKAKWPNTLTLTQTEVFVNEGIGPDPQIGITNSNTVGTVVTTAIVPQNVAVLVHKRSSFTGRTGRGRLYHPTVFEGDVDALGVLSSGALADYQARFTAFLADANSRVGVDFLVILHDSLGAGAALDPRQITALTVDTRVATQRRRLRR